MAYGRHAIEKRGRNGGVLEYISYNFQDTKMRIPGTGYLGDLGGLCRRCLFKKEGM